MHSLSETFLLLHEVPDSNVASEMNMLESCKSFLQSVWTHRPRSLPFLVLYIYHVSFDATQRL